MKLKDIPIELIDVIIKSDHSGWVYRYLQQTNRRYYQLCQKNKEYTELFKAAWVLDVAKKLWSTQSLICGGSKYLNEHAVIQDISRLLINYKCKPRDLINERLGKIFETYYPYLHCFIEDEIFDVLNNAISTNRKFYDEHRYVRLHEYDDQSNMQLILLAYVRRYCDLKYDLPQPLKFKDLPGEILDLIIKSDPTGSVCVNLAKCSKYYYQFVYPDGYQTDVKWEYRYLWYEGHLDQFAKLIWTKQEFIVRSSWINEKEIIKLIKRIFRQTDKSTQGFYGQAHDFELRLYKTLNHRLFNKRFSYHTDNIILSYLLNNRVNIVFDLTIRFLLCGDDLPSLIDDI